MPRSPLISITKGRNIQKSVDQEQRITFGMVFLAVKSGYRYELPLYVPGGFIPLLTPLPLLKCFICSQKTYKNLDQRVQLECDGQKIPLPSLQGIVILNIPR